MSDEKNKNGNSSMDWYDDEELNSLGTRVTLLEQSIEQIKTDVTSMRTDFHEFKGDVKKYKDSVDDTNAKLDAILAHTTAMNAILKTRKRL